MTRLQTDLETASASTLALGKANSNNGYAHWRFVLGSVLKSCLGIEKADDCNAPCWISPKSRTRLVASQATDCMGVTPAPPDASLDGQGIYSLFTSHSRIGNDNATTAGQFAHRWGPTTDPRYGWLVNMQERARRLPIV